ncbi:TetR/AcrR family transcriptional regulator [Massilia sp. GCM10023247]|uniref:TetR/AcrR family transcriptional regulator n=1 Tax=Massilia sp. GCM10023247 TaxID=3252643 RepID=UPI003622B0BC
MLTFPANSTTSASNLDAYRPSVVAGEGEAGAAREPALGQRRSQEDRSREARERLLAAAIDVLIRKGYGGLTTKEVASCAQMSNGALMHHFASKEELLVAATAAVYQAAAVRGQKRANTAEAAKAPIEGFVTDCLSIYFDWPFTAALEVVMVARTDPALMARLLPVMQEYRQTVNGIWLKTFVEAGMRPERAETVLNLTLNLIRGMAVNSLWGRDDKLYERQLEEWIALMYATLSRD